MGILKKYFSVHEQPKKRETVKLIKPKVEKADEISAIIAAAIHLYVQEYHDFENMSLTIKRIDKNYSPWSSKIYGLRKWPR